MCRITACSPMHGQTGPSGDVISTNYRACPSLSSPAAPRTLSVHLEQLSTDEDKLAITAAANRSSKRSTSKLTFWARSAPDRQKSLPVASSYHSG